MPVATKFGALPARRKVGPSAFLTVQEGCDKFCTYCVVPYTRGAEVSRAFAVIVDEAKALVDARSEEHTSELQSLMRISYAVSCLHKPNNEQLDHQNNPNPVSTHHYHPA